jgi:hypothetical protein
MAQTRQVVEEVEKHRGHLSEETWNKIGRDTGVGSKTKVKDLLAEHRSAADLWNRLVELGRNFPKNFRR